MASPHVRTASDRRLRQREEARQTILDAAEGLLAAEGSDRFSMRKLAARCGYTAPTLYHYFGDKNSLFATLLELRIGEMVEEMRQVPSGSDPVENMRSLFGAFVRWGLANPSHYQLLTSNIGPHPTGEVARELLLRPVQELDASGRLATDFETARRAFWALVHGLISLSRTRPDLEWSEQLIDRSLDAMIRGLVLPTR